MIDLHDTQAKMLGTKALEKEQAECDHEWQVFRETIRADNPNFGGAAYFRVQGCLKCKTKKRLELVVEA